MSNDYRQAMTAAAGLVTFDESTSALRTSLDEVFLSWARQAGARPMHYPPLVDVEGLAQLDYFRNFPQLAVLATGLNPAAQRQYASQESPTDHIGTADVETVHYALPSAACFNVYLSLRGELLTAQHTITTSATCFRREDEYHDRRLLAFTMREIVFLGEREQVLDNLADLKKVVTAFAEHLGLPLALENSSDPFFESGGARALMAQLFPVKQEFVYHGKREPLAIGSVNFHRNFFGERCGIQLPDESAAYSGCVAFGLERWVSVLSEQFGEEAVTRLNGVITQ
ncbi:hypothetical protein P3F83_22740 [Mycobacteroides immunogenum]|uniref:hypothetical protein n=1 Tax=Mycobacteroides immunogenum TaxID=83262 RepID=UPI0025B7A61E|nr:hypothetical protein [Mycobacteroides immunogenum]WJR33244.1 hypothetical protein P3F83_22740 [Mycobacteroides immunogenum]